MHRTLFNDGWRFRPKAGGFAEQVAGLGAEWSDVILPHDAMIGTPRSPSARPDNAYFTGGVWEYQRSLDVPADAAGDVLLLRFEGVYRDAVVKVDDTVAGRWAYGYSTFTVPIDHLVRAGKNHEITVECRAGDDSRWYSGAGIHRNVWLLRSGRIHLVPDELHVDASRDDGEDVSVLVSAAVRNVAATTSTAVLRIELFDADGEVVAVDDAPLTTFPGHTASVRRRLLLSPARRWRLDDPYRYTCRATLVDAEKVVDADEVTFGVRTIAVDPRNGLRINGEPVLLRGACVHHDNGPIGAAAIDRADERHVELLKAAGFNAIRSAHNPMSQAMLDACDRLGMLVMDEAFDMWTQSKSDHDYANRFDEWWEADLEAMVRGGRNHPSVIFYSIGNEIPDGSTAVGVRVGRMLAEKIRRLDDTRLVTEAVTGFFAGGPGLRDEFRKAGEAAEADRQAGIEPTLAGIADLMTRVLASPLIDERTTEPFSHLDVAGYNYMDMRFDGDGALHPHRIIVSTESYPPSIDSEWAAVVRNPHVIGEFTWTGWDYLGEVGIGRVEHGTERNALGMTAFLGDYPWLAAWCGDIDITGQRRPQSYYREIVFGLRSEPYLAVHRPEHHGLEVAHASQWAFDDVVSSWTWPSHEDAPVTIDIYSDADEVELLLDGASLGQVAAGPDNRYRARFETTYRSGVLEAVAYRDGTEVGRTRLRSAAQTVRLVAESDRAEVRADPGDLAYVALTLVDDAGTVCSATEQKVEVTVDGPGVLQGLASADPRSEDPLTGSTCTTYEGRALAVVRPTGPGAITVTATPSEGETASVHIEVR